MADIRKRTGKKGVTYQVRYPSKATESGYAYKSFNTLKEARHWQAVELPKLRQPGRLGTVTVEDGINRWLDVCRHEGRRGKDPVSKATMAGYEYRAEIMKAYAWEKKLHALEAPDVVAFRSWLLRNHPRDLARKVLSSFHSMIIEMNEQGVIAHDPARTVTIHGDSRYGEPVRIPSMAEVRLILETSDRLANSKNEQIARAWERYRPMIYLAADSGMRPQEYLALPEAGLRPNGIAVIQALGRDSEICPRGNVLKSTGKVHDGRTPRGAPSPANQKPHMKLRSTASTLAPSRPDFLNSLSHKRTWSAQFVEQGGGSLRSAF